MFKFKNSRLKDLLEKKTSESENDNALFEIAEEIQTHTYAWSSSSSSEEYDPGSKRSRKFEKFMREIGQYNDYDFARHFGVNCSTTQFLSSQYSQYEKVRLQDPNNPRVDCKKDMLMYLWYISNLTTYRELGRMFCTSRTSSEAAVRRVGRWLISIGHHYVKWPSGPAVTENCQQFQRFGNFPGVIGVIDCAHITVKSRSLNHKLYRNKQNCHSIVLQVVVDADMRFINIFCGEPGSNNVRKVLRKSELHQEARSNFREIFPDGTFILGSLAYPPSAYVVPPYKDTDQLTDTQRAFNYMHALTRKVADDAIELLKRRFYRLSKFNEQRTFSAVTNLVVSACVLHNICLMRNDEFIDDNYERYAKYTETLSESTECAPDNEAENETANRRQMLFNYLLDKKII